MENLKKPGFPEIVTLLGTETAGKTTTSKLLARRLGGHALSVPTWPMFEKFLNNPAGYAFENQTEAMSYVLKAKQKALESQPHPLFADTSPDRIHKVHSWGLRENGFLSDYEWSRLDQQYGQAQQQWGMHYVYLRVGLPTAIQRLKQRGRLEDVKYNLQSAAVMLKRWEDIVTDEHWRDGKKVLEISGELNPVEICETIESWLGTDERQEGGKSQL